MLNVNTVTIAGRLTADPVSRPIGTDNSVTDFSVAINKKWKDKSSGELKEDTTFVDVSAFGRQGGEFVSKYLKKGDAVFLTGRLQLDRWQTKEGEKRQRLKVVADNVQGLEPKADAPAAAADEPIF